MLPSTKCSTLFIYLLFFLYVKFLCDTRSVLNVCKKNMNEERKTKCNLIDLERRN